MPPADPSSLEDEETQALMAEIWEEYRETTSGRVLALEQAVAAVQEGTLDDELRRRAVGEAHHLAGSVGSFGFTEATRLARVLEHAFGDPERLGQREAPRLAEVVATLRRNLEGPPGSSAAE